MKGQTKRLHDFEERARGDGADVRSPLDLGRYITVHPMADELELLSRLNFSPEKCNKVDLYWEYRNDVRFVQIMTASASLGRKPGAYARTDRSRALIFLVVVPSGPIDSKLVSNTLKELSRIEIDVNSLSDVLIPLPPPSSKG